MENQFYYLFVVLQFIILSSITTCSGQVQLNKSSASTVVSVSTASTPAFLQSNQTLIKHNAFNGNLDLSNNSTQLKLDKVFEMDIRIFKEYLKDEDLTIIPGLLHDDDFDNWIPPPELPRDFPAYIPGFDYHDRPIWVTEWGKWRFDKYATGSPKKLALFEKYMRYLIYTYLKSQAIRSTKERRITNFICVLEYEGFQPASVLNRKTVQLQVKVFSNYRRFFEKYMSRTIAINVNPIAEVLLNILLPFFNRLLDRFEIYGTNKLIWAPQLLKTIPKDQLPEWYGGYKGYAPFQRF